MLQIGLLSPEFPRATLDENLDAIAATGAVGVQFDLNCAVGESFPQRLEPVDLARIRDGFDRRGLRMAALSGTVNMIDPDRARRAAALDDLKRLIAWAPALGTPVVTLCTGSRNPQSMWRRHPDNDLPEAFDDFLASLSHVLPVAMEHGITLGVEQEVNNVIDSPMKARRMLDDAASPNLKIIMDGANIFHDGELPRMQAVIEEAFALLGHDLCLAHGKDLDHDGDAGHLAAGKGVLDFSLYLRLLAETGYSGAIILHGLKPGEAAGAIAHVRAKAPPGLIEAAPAR